jgi:hypothetical protein
MSNPALNPLFKHFRQPAIYLNLPSKGQYWPEGSIDYPASGDIPVYPMTVKDEITLKTPDALMNGEGMATVIRSCCPNIKDPFEIPICDLDAILIGIRIASYGDEMDITTTCPSCNEKNDNAVELSALLDRLPPPVYGQEKIGGVTIKFKPQKFQSINISNMASFEQQRLIQQIGSSSTLTEEQKQQQLNDMLPKITDLSVQTLLYAIKSISTDEDEVTDIKFIREYIENADTKTFEKIRDHIEKIARTNKIEPLNIKCSSCEKTYKTELNFENSSFFG